MIKYYLSVFLISVLISVNSFSQSVSVSYFFPKDGYFANPIAPLNFGLPVGFGDYFKISSGIGMKNIGGMSMSGFPSDYDSQRALIGPFQSMEISIIPTIVLNAGNAGIDLMGGVFGFTSFNKKIFHGNFNEMIAEAHSFKHVSAEMEMDASLFGWGYIYGFRFNFNVASNVRAFIGADYYLGSQEISFTGRYIGILDDHSVIEQEAAYESTKLLFHGLNITIGATLGKK